MFRITYKDRVILQFQLRGILRPRRPRSFRIGQLIITIEDDF